MEYYYSTFASITYCFYAVTDSGNTVVNFSFTLQNFAKFFTDHDFLLILWRSLSIAFKTTIICILLGYPIAYFISQCKDRTRNILVLLITLPMWINMLVRTYAWIGILSDGGILQSLLNLLDLNQHNFFIQKESCIIRDGL